MQSKQSRRKNMFTIKVFEDNDNVKVTEQLGAFKVAECQRDLSVDSATAQTAFYAVEMNVRGKQ